ncbi:hypothetical protein BKA62DRAFT_776304 [Auriculariales sp. MPI-PUGE-AT-0066]|nr:hypothetical protein BKA62DRAFT_776304 [Auriculariales sp. MPI-PUGE-AT-0066]
MSEDREKDLAVVKEETKEDVADVKDDMAVEVKKVTGEASESAAEKKDVHAKLPVDIVPEVGEFVLASPSPPTPTEATPTPLSPPSAETALSTSARAATTGRKRPPIPTKPEHLRRGNTTGHARRPSAPASFSVSSLTTASKLRKAAPTRPVPALLHRYLEDHRKSVFLGEVMDSPDLPPMEDRVPSIDNVEEDTKPASAAVEDEKKPSLPRSKSAPAPVLAAPTANTEPTTVAADETPPAGKPTTEATPEPGPESVNADLKQARPSVRTKRATMPAVPTRALPSLPPSRAPPRVPRVLSRQLWQMSPPRLAHRQHPSMSPLHHLLVPASPASSSFSRTSPTSASASPPPPGGLPLRAPIIVANATPAPAKPPPSRSIPQRSFTSNDLVAGIHGLKRTGKRTATVTDTSYLPIDAPPTPPPPEDSVAPTSAITIVAPRPLKKYFSPKRERIEMGNVSPSAWSTLAQTSEMGDDEPVARGATPVRDKGLFTPQEPEEMEDAGAGAESRDGLGNSNARAADLAAALAYALARRKKTMREHASAVGGSDSEEDDEWD